MAVTAGSADKLEVCRELGAEILVNYREQDFVEEVRAATAGAGADVILDNMGAKYLARNVDALAVNGRLVVIGLQGGAKAELDLGPAAAQAGGRHRHVAAGPAGRREGRHRRGRARARLAAGRGGSGRARSSTAATRSPQAADAHRELEASGHIGKILLTPEPATSTRRGPARATRPPVGRGLPP